MLGDFFADRCALDAAATVGNPELWKAYTDWCEQNGERRPLGRKQFTERLERRGLEPDRDHYNGRFWHGIGLLQAVP